MKYCLVLKLKAFNLTNCVESSLLCILMDMLFFSFSKIVMQKAWRERNPQARISAAHEALEINE